LSSRPPDPQGAKEAVQVAQDDRLGNIMRWPRATESTMNSVVATRSRVCARVEHVSGHQASTLGGKLLRTIGLVRARSHLNIRTSLAKRVRSPARNGRKRT
jgi:hypothetical protein